MWRRFGKTADTFSWGSWVKGNWLLARTERHACLSLLLRCDVTGYRPEIIFVFLQINTLDVDSFRTVKMHTLCQTEIAYNTYALYYLLRQKWLWNTLERSSPQLICIELIYFEDAFSKLVRSLPGANCKRETELKTSSWNSVNVLFHYSAMDLPCVQWQGYVAQKWKGLDPKIKELFICEFTTDALFKRALTLTT